MSNDADLSSGRSERDHGREGFPTQIELLKVRNGSLNVWELLEGCRRYLLSIANQRYPTALNGAEGPSDLVQDTIIKAARGFENFRGCTSEELRGWLGAILKSTVLNLELSYERAKRKKKLSVSLPDELPDSGMQSPSAPLRSEEERASVEAALARLKEEHRQVLQYRHAEGLSFAEIGTLMGGRSADGTRKLWARALKALESELTPQNPT